MIVLNQWKKKCYIWPQTTLGIFSSTFLNKQLRKGFQKPYQH